MPKDIHQRDTAQQRSSRLLLAMGIIVLLGALATSDPEQYAALVAALGGGDHGGTRLWWDAGRNF